MREKKRMRKFNNAIYSSKIEGVITENLFNRCYPLIPILFFVIIAPLNFSKGYIPVGEDTISWIIFGFILSLFYTETWYMTLEYWNRAPRFLSYMLFFLILTHAILGTFSIENIVGLTVVMVPYLIAAHLLKFRSIAIWMTMNLLWIIMVVQAFLDQSTEVFTNWDKITWISLDVLVFFYLIMEIVTRISFRGKIWDTIPPVGVKDNTGVIVSTMLEDAVKAASRTERYPSYVTDYCDTCGSRRPCYDCDTVCKVCRHNESMCQCN